MAHGFTQTGRVWGSMDDDLAADHQRGAGGHARARRFGRGGGRSGRRCRRCWATPVDGPPTSGTRWGRGSACIWRWPARTWSTPGARSPAPPGSTDDDERRQRREADGRPGRRARSRRRQKPPPDAGRGVHSPLAGEPDVRRDQPQRPTALPSGCATPAPGWPPACDWPAPVPSTRCGSRSAELAMPVLIVTGELDQKFTALGRRMAGSSGPTPATWSWPGPATPPTCSGPVRWPTWCGRPSAGSARRLTPAGPAHRIQSHSDDRQQHAEHQLQPTGGRQHGEQGPARTRRR